MAFDQWRELSRTFYDAGTAARALKPDHAPVVFVTFEYEHVDITLGRGALFASIPGDKRLVLFPGTTHYFNAVDFHRLALADTSSGRRLAASLDEWLKETASKASSELLARERPGSGGQSGSVSGTPARAYAELR